MAWHHYSVHLYFDKARCFNQKERALLKNFIKHFHKSQDGAFWDIQALSLLLFAIFILFRYDILWQPFLGCYKCKYGMLQTQI